MLEDNGFRCPNIVLDPSRCRVPWRRPPTRASAVTHVSHDWGSVDGSGLSRHGRVERLVTVILISSRTAGRLVFPIFQRFFDHAEGSFPRDPVRGAAGGLQEPVLDRAVAHPAEGEKVIRVFGATAGTRFDVASRQGGPIAAAWPLAAKPVALDDFGDEPAHRRFRTPHGRREIVRAERLGT